MTFDPRATGPARNSIRTFDATGTDLLPVRVETDAFTATCQRADLDAAASTIRLTGGSRPVYYRQLKGEGRQFLLDRGTFDYVTKEWSDQLRLVEIEPQTPQTPQDQREPR